MPRPLIGQTPMTSAERQARYRAAHANGAPVIRVRRRADRRSRIQRWNDTITGLVELQAEYAAWLEALPDNHRTAQSPRPSRRLSNSISRSCRRSSHQGASDVTKQQDGLYGIGHDDARAVCQHLPVLGTTACRCRGERAE